MNYYQILGVKRDATQAEIKKRYKSLMKKYHPDLYEGDKKFAETKAMEINMAYDTLSVPELREEYDMELSVEEEAKRPDFSNYNPVNNSNPTQENHYSYYDNDEVMRNIYERYNRYKDNYMFHKHYKQSRRPNPTSTQYYNGYSTATEEYVNEKINQAERYVEKRIDNLKFKQKILVFIIAILCLLLFFMVSFYELAKFMEDYSNPPPIVEQETPKKNNYNIKNSIQEAFGNMINNAVTNDTTNTTNPEDEFYYDAYGNKVYPNRTNPESNTGNSLFKGWNIDTSVLNGLSDQIKERLEYYYDYVIEYLDKNGAFKDITEDEAKTILYHYLYTTPQEYKEWIKEATKNIHNALNQPEPEEIME